MLIDDLERLMKGIGVAIHRTLTDDDNDRPSELMGCPSEPINHIQDGPIAVSKREVGDDDIIIFNE